MNCMATYYLSYNEMAQFLTFEERYRYLKQNAKVAEDTFGFERYLNQQFYKSREWQQLRNHIIVRDNGCDLGCPDHPIQGSIYIHHINPISKEDVIEHSDKLVDPNNLVCVSLETHNAIHYGDDQILEKYEFAERTPNDTCPWKL